MADRNESVAIDLVEENGMVSLLFDVKTNRVCFPPLAAERLGKALIRKAMVINRREKQKAREAEKRGSNG